MGREELIRQIGLKKSMLCVGLDPVRSKMPAFFQEKEDGLFEFCKAIVEATAEYSVAVKPNLAFFEAEGVEGWKAFQKLCDYVNSEYPELLLIADAKRGDIGNTSMAYAKAFFEIYGCDAITVAPYMGSDSVKPFLEYTGRWTIVLGLTSNIGASDFEMKNLEGGVPLYKEVVHQVSNWGGPEQLMFVTGATQSAYLSELREMLPEYFFLVPGVGAQGGTVEEVCKSAITSFGGLLINASRSILYASSGEDFALAAAKEAASLQSQMEGFL